MLVLAKIAPVGNLVLSRATGTTGANAGVCATGIGAEHAVSMAIPSSAIGANIFFITLSPVNDLDYMLLFKKRSMPSAAEIAFELIS